MLCRSIAYALTLLTLSCPVICTAPCAVPADIMQQMDPNGMVVLHLAFSDGIDQSTQCMVLKADAQNKPSPVFAGYTSPQTDQKLCITRFSMQQPDDWVCMGMPNESGLFRKPSSELMIHRLHFEYTRKIIMDSFVQGRDVKNPDAKLVNVSYGIYDCEGNLQKTVDVSKKILPWSTIETSSAALR